MDICNPSTIFQHILSSCCLLALTFNGAVNHADDSLPLSLSTSTSESYITPNFPAERWLFVAGKKDAQISETWKIGEDETTRTPILICKGEPHGYLKTRENFTNFELQVDWRFPEDPDGNSGLLLFTSGEDAVWPASLQVQFHQPELGSTFPVGGAKTANEIRITEKLAKPLNQWNHCEIVAQNGVVTVNINGRVVGQVAGCSLTSGAIGLQSEGSEIHFRSLTIRPLPSNAIEDISLNSKASDPAPAQK